MTWVQHYLDRLGLKAEPPSYHYLARLCRAHLSRIAFENISKLYYLKRFPETGWHIPPIDVHVANMRGLDFGGTCFTSNSRFHLLLQALGFDASLVGFASNHMGMAVRLPEGRFYVDVGAALPFFEPVPFEAEPFVECCGVGARFYRKGGAYRLDHYLHGECTMEWEFYPDSPQAFSHFAPKVEVMNAPGSLFLTILRCHLWQPELGRCLSLVNNSLTWRFADGTERKERLASLQAIERAVSEEFRLPKLPVREAVAVLETLGIDLFAPPKA
jgi:N-hydroxyarylamine O-acetyltransferase